MWNNAEYADCKSESYCSIISCNAMDVTTRPDGSFLAVLVLGDWLRLLKIACPFYSQSGTLL